jgi:hypothetical protein
MKRAVWNDTPFGPIAVVVPDGCDVDREIEVTDDMRERAEALGLTDAQLACIAVKAAFPEATEVFVNGVGLRLEGLDAPSPN